MLGPEISRFIGPILQLCNSQCPLTCSCCGKRYETFGAYVRDSQPIGVIPDLVEDDDPLGFLSLANCWCGTTLALKCEYVAAHAEFLAALERDCASSGRSAADILGELRDEIRVVALREG